MKWFKGSTQIKDADRYILTNKGQVATLEIDGVKDSDAGEYKVVVGNEYGDIEQSFSLTVGSGKKDDANGPSSSAKSMSSYFCFPNSLIGIGKEGKHYLRSCWE